MRVDGVPLGAAGDGPPAAGFASLVRDRRRAAGLTQLQLAAAAGVSIGVVRDLEQGRTWRPRRRSVERIAAALGAETELSAAAEAGHAGPAGHAHPAGHEEGSARGLRLRVLGSLTAWRDGGEVALGPARQRAVLGLLAAQPNSLVRREAICEALWEADPPATAVNMIQSYVSRLRRLLGPAQGPGGDGGLLVAAGSGYRLQLSGEQLDLIAFMQLCARAREAARAGQPEAACALYEEALDLWEGEPLADVDTLRGHPAVSGLARQWATAAEDYADAASGQGWHSRVLAPLRALTVREPLNERAHALLMVALAGSGQQAAALEIFDAVRRRLDGELGIQPGAELSAAHARVLRQHIPTATAEPGTSLEAAAPAAMDSHPAATPPARPAAAAAERSGGHARPGRAPRGQRGREGPGGSGRAASASRGGIAFRRAGPGA